MPANILALSGGGFRGLYTVRVLRRLEERIQKPLADHFDLITGTSIGGIIALGIAAGIPLEKIEETFKEKGKCIFPFPVVPKNDIKPFWLVRPVYSLLHEFTVFWRKARAILRPIHSNDGLKAVLEELFGDMRMKDLNQAYVCVTAANLSTGEPKMFKTPHHKEIYLDKDIRVVDVALATSAAPAYFPIHKIEDTQTMFADGALMGNAPGLFGWIEAKTRLGISENDISVLAVGTLAGKPSISGSTDPRRGALFWLGPGKLRLLTFLMTQQEQLTHSLLNILLKDRYHRVDGSASDEASGDIDLDDASDAAVRTLISHAEKHFAEFTSSEFCKTHFPLKEAA